MGSAASRPFELDGIDHVLLVIEDMPRALSFYQDVLGCELKRALPQYGMVELRAGRSALDLVDASAAEGAWARPPGPGRNMDHLCLAISARDPDGLRRHLAAHDVPVVEERTDMEDGRQILSLYVRDPSGNTIELKAPMAGAGA
jgi:glyoxylase I family protein